MAGTNAEDDTSSGANEPAWRQRAVSRSLDAARSRAEKRAKRFLDAAFELMDEKGSTEFTIQEVIDRSQQSLRGFYQYFDGKDELLLALFEETVRECIDDIRAVVEAETE
ncbi:MAG TPA: helix-turn-helix domain-containing protein, partial [Acidimicrobiia bacterium]